MTGDPGDVTAPGNATGTAPTEGGGSAAEHRVVELSVPPAPSETFLDARGGDRWMRATWHPEADCVVLSVWRATTCIATVRVARDDVPGLVQTLVAGLAVPSTRSR